MKNIMLSLSVLLVFMFIGCTDDSADEESKSTLDNTVPVANAGVDRTVTISSLVTLDGSQSSDADFDQLTYLWSIIEKPDESSIALTNPTIINPTFIPDVDGDYQFSLIVNDGTASSTMDTVVISVVQSTPTAQISASATDLIYKTTVHYLDASSSYDPEGVVDWIGWQYDGEESYTLSYMSDKHTLNTFLTPGIHTVTLILFDEGNQVSTDTIDVTIKLATPEPIYECPVSGVGSVETVMSDGSIRTCSYFSYGVSEGRISHETRHIEDQYGLYKDGYETSWQDNGLKSSQIYWQNKEALVHANYDSNGDMTTCTSLDGSSCMP